MKPKPKTLKKSQTQKEITSDSNPEEINYKFPQWILSLKLNLDQIKESPVKFQNQPVQVDIELNDSYNIKLKSKKTCEEFDELSWQANEI